MRLRHLLLLVPLMSIGCERWRQNRLEAALEGLEFSPDLFGRRPFRDQWRTELQLPFPPTGIETLDVGGVSTRDNFANRGDVIVRYDQTDQITVELRRFTHTTELEAAQRDFAHLELWASTGELVPTSLIDPADDCREQWRSGCAIRVRYDGLSQLRRSGADIRVTLPASFRGELTVITEDDVADGDYSQRGDVCIEGLAGSATVELGSGRAWVDLADDVTPTPECGPTEVAACESWTELDEDGVEAPAAWSPQCPCLADEIPFGEISVRTRPVDAAEITVDLPARLWSSIEVINEDGGPRLAHPHCRAKVGVPGFVPGPDDEGQPWWRRGTVALPGPLADVDGGYAVSLSSSRCAEITFTDDPEHFVGRDRADRQLSAWRGRVHACTDCLTQGCDALLP